MKDQARHRSSLLSGWQGVGLIVVTYIYFLIFAQFAFLKRLAELDIAGSDLKLVMGAMAGGGILVSLFCYRLEGRRPVRARLQLAFLGCGFGAMLTLVRMNVAGGVAISFLIGASVGLLTVTLVTHLRTWIGEKHPVLKVGLGTGLAYLACNVPALFTATPRDQAVVSALLCLVAIGFAAAKSEGPDASEVRIQTGAALPFWFALACFTALVWLDSAAFFIIQNSPVLKSGTWEGAHRLWLIGGMHLAAALASATLLRRFGLMTPLVLALICLGAACVLLENLNGAPLAAELYPLGVSLYSVALVAYPSFFANAPDARSRAKLSGLLYAIAGWFGSAMGIGMGQKLHQVPVEFIVAAALLFAIPWGWRFLAARRLEAVATFGLLLMSWFLSRVPVEQPRVALTSVELGRQVYISEGCMNCHSQYIRPGTADELMWGPANSATGALAAVPPLLGNRRQGPDLAEVGSYRSGLWLKVHFMNPSTVSHGSIMPSYTHLFSDSRGLALVAYLESLGQDNADNHRDAAAGWEPAKSADALASNFNGSRLIEQSCATCHSPDGATRLEWKSDFRRLPPDLVKGPFEYVPATADPEWRRRRFAEIIKFGLPGTDMPGHEYLPDAAIVAMARQLERASSAMGKR